MTTASVRSWSTPAMAPMASSTVGMMSPEALRARINRDGYLLLRQALPSAFGIEVLDDIGTALAQWGIVQRGTPLSYAWTGQPVPFLDRITLESGPPISTLSHALARGAEPSIHRLGALLLGHSARAAARVHIYCSIPDDPAYSSPPHQDDYGLAAGSCYRLWIPLTPIASGNGSLAVGRGSHLLGRLAPERQLRYRARPVSAAASPVPPIALAWGAAAGTWCTSGFEPGDVVVMHPDLVHAALPSRGNRVRVAIACGISLAALDEAAETPWSQRAERQENST